MPALMYVDDRAMLVVHLDPQQLVVWTHMLIYSKLLEEAWLCWQREIAANRFLYSFCENKWIFLLQNIFVVSLSLNTYSVYAV